jgi:hypothetical protein
MLTCIPPPPPPPSPITHNSDLNTPTAYLKVKARVFSDMVLNVLFKVAVITASDCGREREKEKVANERQG